MLLIVDILAIIRVALRVAVLISLLLLPFSVTVLQPVLELAGVTAAVHPLILTKAFRLSIDVLADEYISICEEVTSITRSQAAFPFSFIFVTIAPDVHSVSLCF